MNNLALMRNCPAGWGWGIVQGRSNWMPGYYSKYFHAFLAHQSQRLTGELIGYPWSGVRPLSVRPQFQTSSPLKPLGQSKPNFMWSLLGKGEQKFI